MNRKKSFILLFVVILLSACGGNTPSQQPATTLRIITATPRATTPPTATATPRVPEMSAAQMTGITVDFWYVAEPNLEDPFPELISDFENDNPFNLKVTATRFEHADEMEQAMQAAAADGDLPDVVLAYPYQYNAWLDDGVSILALDDYVDSPIYGLSTDQTDDLYPVFWTRDVYTGVRRAMPGLFYGNLLIYNRTWAKQLGFQAAPQSADQFLLQACAAATANDDSSGGWMIDTQPGSAAAWLLSYAGDLESADGYRFDVPEISQAFTFLAGMRDHDCAWRPDNLYAFDDFAARKGLFYSLSTRALAAASEIFMEDGFTDQWELIGVPNNAGDPAVGVYGRSYVIVQSNLAQQLAAWLLVTRLSDADNQVALAEALGTYPLSATAADRLSEDGAMPEAWVNALALLDNAYYEPRWASWAVVRGVVQDAAAEVLKPGFEVGTISAMLDQFTQTANDLNSGN